MIVDLRRFEYPLEPVRRQRRWELEALQAELGRAQAAVELAEQEVQALRTQLREQSARAAANLVARLDPSSYPRALGWLVRLRESLVAAEERAATLRAERERLRRECLEQQRKVDVVERHREECVAEFAKEEGSRLASEADKDWLARAGAGVGEVAPGGES